MTLIGKVRNVLSGPNKWTRNTYFRDKEGNKVPTDAPPSMRCKFCIIGAVRHVFDPEDPVTSLNNKQKAFRYIRNSLDEKWYRDIPKFNDDPSTTFEDVQALLDKAEQLELAENQESLSNP